MNVPSHLHTHTPQEPTTINHSVRNLQRKTLAIFDYIQSTTGERVRKSKVRWDESVKNADIFEIGQKILYREYNTTEARTLGPAYKLEPYTVIRRTGANYLIRPEGAENEKADKMVNRDQIRPFIEADEAEVRERLDREAAATTRRRLGFMAAAEAMDQTDIQ